MATSFDIRTTASVGGIDTRWRASKHGEENARPGQLDVSTVPSGVIVNGRVPSGLALTYNDTSGFYEYWDADDEDAVVDGFLNDDAGVEVVVAGGTVDSEPIAVLVHGIVDPQYLPVEAQRDAIREADTGAVVLVK